MSFDPDETVEIAALKDETRAPAASRPSLEEVEVAVELDDDVEASAPERGSRPASETPEAAKAEADSQKKERVRPKLTLRIPDDEVARPEVKREPTTQPDLAAAIVAEGGAPSDASDTVPPPPPGPDDSSEIPMASASILLIEPDPSSPSVPPVLGDEPRFEELKEGPFADDAEEDSWTPWQPTAIELREASAPRAEGAPAATALPAVAPKAPAEAQSVPADVEEIPLEPDEEDEDWQVPSNPPEVEPEDLLLVEPATASMVPAVGAKAVPQPIIPAAAPAPVVLPVIAAAPPTPATPPSAPALPTVPVLSAPLAVALPAGVGMESLPPAALPTPAAPQPVSVVSTPKLHQVLAEGGPRVGATPTAPAATPPSEPRALDGKRRGKPWWEELFNDDYLRTTGSVTDREIAAEATFIEESLGVAKGATVLDLACGSGRHAIELAARGYQVIGFDLSLAMLARASDEAQERNQKLNFVQGDMREMTFEDAFDGVYCWQTSFGFFEEEKNATVVGNVHRALKKGGQFLLEVVNRDYVAHDVPSLVWFEGDGCICMDEVHLDFITSRLRVKRTMMMDDGRSKEIEYSVRVYSLHELGKLLNDAGFRVAEVSGRIQTPGVFFGGEAPSIIILAEKR
ncbi:MAG: methyltransferase domain-containing protein [Myxococcales bacterium]|nr:methyltransferase domain-containing protein [Myxococcales bacterium]HQY61275.1 methyltransferase domain-containing protein [Polyangiaceae bacterium]